MSAARRSGWGSSHASPVHVPSIEALKPQLSAKPSDNPWWTGLDARTEAPELDARGQPTGGTLKTTTVERFSLARAQQLMGRSTPKVDNYLEGLHGSLSSVSRVLATDVVSVLEKTKGIDMLTANRPAYMSSYLGNQSFTYTFGRRTSTSPGSIRAWISRCACSSRTSAPRCMCRCSSTSTRTAPVATATAARTAAD
ncbi:hypothetical protein ACN28S_14985 [Cystobacter fuscus]